MLSMATSPYALYSAAHNSLTLKYWEAVTIRHKPEARNDTDNDTAYGPIYIHSVQNYQ